MYIFCVTFRILPWLEIIKLLLTVWIKKKTLDNISVLSISSTYSVISTVMLHISPLQYLDDLLYTTDPCIKLIQLFIVYCYLLLQNSTCNSMSLKDVVGVLMLNKIILIKMYHIRSHDRWFLMPNSLWCDQLQHYQKQNNC